MTKLSDSKLLELYLSGSVNGGDRGVGESSGSGGRVVEGGGGGHGNPVGGSRVIEGNDGGNADKRVRKSEGSENNCGGNGREAGGSSSRSDENDNGREANRSNISDNSSEAGGNENNGDSGRRVDTNGDKSPVVGNDSRSAAISTLIDRHRRRVTDYIAMMVKDRDTADDIFQEAIIKVMRVIDEGRYCDNGKFLSWVLRIAHNQVIDHFRHIKQENMVSESDAGFDILGTMKFSDETVEDQLVHDQIRNDLRRIIDHLPDEQKEVVLMRYFDNMSFKEIADESGVSINTALGRMRYALINLRKLIREHHVTLTV